MHGPATDQPGASGASRVGDGAVELVVVVVVVVVVVLVVVVVVVVLVVLVLVLVLVEADGNGVPPQSVPRAHSMYDHE